jgi:hypothetical protein
VYCKAIFDNKLLDYSAKQGFGRTSDKIESRRDSGRSGNHSFYRLFRGEIVPDLTAGDAFHKHSAGYSDPEGNVIGIMENDPQAH